MKALNKRALESDYSTESINYPIIMYNYKDEKKKKNKRHDKI